jgi:GH15 family glucan-1,4-alpha-glucosidase
MARYLPIAEHGLIGDLHTVALVGTDGTIDWYCCPRFDSPSVFAAILDADNGGRFRIAPQRDGWTSKQLYLPDTNVLITRFLMPDGVGELQDFMPPPRMSAGVHRHRIIRRVLAVRGQMHFAVDVSPRFDYAHARHDVALTPHGALFRSPDLHLSLSTRCPIEIVDGSVRALITVPAGDAVTFVLDRVEPGERPVPYSDDDIAAQFDATVKFWRRWLRGSQYGGRWREMVHRSALTLKLLTYAPTGAIVAAPTTSLPEELGGVRNWDYRYTWLRDAAFTLYALLRLGFTEEAAAFLQWLEQRIDGANDRDSGPLQIMYGIDGREDLREEELPHLEGYMRSAPVRVGNGAATQLQLDVYGELMDSLYLCNKYGLPIYHDGWIELTRSLEWLIDHWDQPDAGVWEPRGGRRDYTYSRLMSWVAVERAIRIARQRGLPADLPRWSGVRDNIYRQIMQRGWHPVRRAFVQHYEPTRSTPPCSSCPCASSSRRRIRGGCRRSMPSPQSSSPTASSTATRSTRHPMAYPGPRRLSRCAPSGGSKHSRAPVGSMRRSWRSRRCSRTRTMSVSTPKRSVRRASNSASFHAPRAD